MIKISTSKAIENAKAGLKGYKFPVDGNLFIWVQTNGNKTWNVRYVVNGKQLSARLPKLFGTSSDAYMSLSEARAMNAQIQALAKSGIDFKLKHNEEIKAEEEKRNTDKTKRLTFRDLFQAWIDSGDINRKDNNKSLILTFNKHVLPKIQDLEVRNISDTNLKAIYQKLIKEDKKRTAKSIADSVRQIFKWAEQRKPWRFLLSEGNPTELIKIKKLLGGLYTEERNRVLPDEEIKLLQTKFAVLKKNYKTAENKYSIERPLKDETEYALWICLGTICRIGELVQAEWKHIKFKDRVWFIPKENVKDVGQNTQDHYIYLSDFTLDIFKMLFKNSGETKWVFPNDKTNSHIDPQTISKQVGDRQIKFKNRKKLSNRVNSNSLVLGDEKWTPHDLRRTGSTIMQKMKVPLDVIDRCQNHVLAGNKIRRHYMMYEYADEKKEAWIILGNYLNSILK